MEELDQDFLRKKVSEDEAGIFGNLDDADGECLLEDENDKKHQKSPSQCPFCLEECKTLRVLSCLHVFCEDCVEQFVETQKNTESQKPGNLSRTKLRGLLSCPTCQQETLLGERGLISLPVDPVSQDKVSSQGRKPPVFICTACKNNDKADAKCLDCNNFLCSKCYSFHQYMRCFENHKVLSIEAFVDDETVEQQSSNPLCGEHPTEELRFYCNTCQMAACTQCLGDYHAGSAHCTERMRDAESRCRDELQLLCDQTSSHQTVCRQTARKLETMFGELQTQSDTARESIETAHQFYVAQITKKRDEMLVELKNLHKMLELKIMDASHRVERVRERMDHALDYTHKILNLDNPVGILKLREQIKAQLTLLLSTPSSEDLNITMKFENDPKQFDEMLKTLYGRFVTRGDGASPKFFAAEALTPSPTPLPHTPSLNSLPVMNKFAFEPSTVLQGPTGPYDMLGTITSAQERNIKQLAALIHQQLGPLDDPSKQKFASCLPDPVENSVGLTGQTLNNLQALAMLSMQSNQRFGPPATEQNLHLLTPPLRNKMGSGNAFPWGADSSTANPPPPYSLPSRQPFPVEPETSRSMKAFSPPGMVSSSAKQVPSSKFLPMQVRVKFGQLGFEQGQFNSPHGFCLGSGEDILVADTNNHRVQVFDQKGNFKFQFGEPGKDDGQLWFPRKIAVLRGSGNVVVCDRGNARSRIQLFSCMGLYLKKFSISYMEIVAGIVVNHRNNILMVDSVNPSVYELNVNGTLETWFDCSNIMREPSDIAVYNEKYYICDFKASCVAVFDDSGKCISRIGDEGVLPFPNGIDISAAGEIVVGTSHGNRFRVIVFDNAGALIAQYECPHIKVSRCCGLRITSKGYIVTLAKNSHHVLVFNTLYVM